MDQSISLSVSLSRRSAEAKTVQKERKTIAVKKIMREREEKIFYKQL